MLIDLNPLHIREITLIVGITITEIVIIIIAIVVVIIIITITIMLKVQVSLLVLNVVEQTIYWRIVSPNMVKALFVLNGLEKQQLERVALVMGIHAVVKILIATLLVLLLKLS
jgi:hypothetical protein